MPTYDYECKSCGKTFEIFQSISEAVKKKCPSCGKQKLVRLIGAGAGFIFKGSGFYTTDYRSSDYKEKAKAESGDSTKESKESKESKDSKGSKEASGKSEGASGGSAKEAKASKKKDG
jgi:putative FmdB family regulatory protein